MKNNISEDEYRRHLAAASTTGNYFTFRECYLDILSRDATMVLQKCINKYGYLLKKKKLHKSGWVVLTVKQLENLKMKRDCQIRVLRELQGFDKKGNLNKERQFILVKKKGVPPRRIVWIDFLKLNRAMDKAHPDTSKLNGREIPLIETTGNPVERTSGNPVDLYRNEDTNVSSESNRKKTHCRRDAIASLDGVREVPNSPVQDHFIVDSTDDKECQLDTYFATTLYESLKAKGKLTTHKYNPDKWRKEFEQLRRSIDNNTKLISLVLKWYCANIGGKFVPQVFCAQTFHRRFRDVEAAMERAENDKASNQLSPAEKAFILRRYGDVKPLGPIFDEVPKLHFLNNLVSKLRGGYGYFYVRRENGIITGMDFDNEWTEPQFRASSPEYLESVKKAKKAKKKGNS